jgi:tRNA threonylcarbamoyladenosine biosynthesis protein TsaB
MTWTLGIDSSSFELGLGLYRDAAPVCGFSRYVTNSHAEHIANSVDFLLKSNAVKSSDISRLGIAIGPGSFTGLRIGIAFIKGFCLERQIQVMPTSSLESVAHAWPSADGPLVVAFDARRNEVFWARFERTNGIIKRLTEDTLSTIQVFRDAIQINDTVITDTLGYERSRIFDNTGTGARVIRLESNPVQRGLACARIAAQAPDDSVWMSAVDVQPQYLRLSAAEEKALVH